MFAQEYHFSVSKSHQLRSEGTASFSREEHFSASDSGESLEADNSTCTIHVCETE